MNSEQNFEGQLQNVISRTHQLLASNFTLVPQTRDLDIHQDKLLLSLDQNQIKYKQLAGSLAIEAYSQYVIQLLSGCQPLLQVTALIFGNLSEARSWALQSGATELADILEQSWLNLGKLAQITHKLFPRSPMVAIHRSFIDEAGSDPSEAIYGRLYEENLDLKSKLEQNDRQVLQLQLKLTKLLQQHDGCDGNIDSSLRMLEIREQLALKNQQIQRMNEQFGAQIQKYNTVYQAMKRQIQDLKDFRDADLIEMVQRLQTEIVKLREQKERDEILIRELRQRGVMSYHSPNRKANAYSRVYY